MLLSTAVHAIVVTMILTGSPPIGLDWREQSDLTVPDPVQEVAESELVEEKDWVGREELPSEEEKGEPLAAEPVGQPRDPPRTNKNATRIDFAGSPAQNGETSSRVDTEPEDSGDLGEYPMSGQEVVSTAPTVNAEPELMPPGDEMDREGVTAPAFQAIGLTASGMDKIVRSGQGVYLAFCGEEVYVVRGSLSAPSLVAPSSARDLAWLSQRALPLQDCYCERVAQRLKWDFAVADTDLTNCKLRLVFNNQLDHLIYKRQREAISATGRRVEEVAVTVGSLEFADEYVHDFRVRAIVLQDGHRLYLKSDGSTTRKQHGPDSASGS